MFKTICLGGILFFASNGFAAANCSKSAGALVDSTRKMGERDTKNPIQNIVVVMQENHSFDTYLGRLSLPQFYGNEIDGIQETMWNSDHDGKKIFAHHELSRCIDDPEHDWNAIHREWNDGKMDGFVRINDVKAMGYYDQTDLPFYYDIANKFTVGDRYFCSSLTQTFPNRFYLYTATSFGHILNDFPEEANTQFAQKTIFDDLNAAGVSWKYYKDDIGYLILFQPLYNANRAKIVPVKEFAQDLAAGTLPEVAMIDSGWDGQDQHPNANIQTGQKFVAQRLKELVDSDYWKKSVFFLTYDEGGGFFDHMAPPEACEPDDIQPMLIDGSMPGKFDRLGIRVPFVAVSPYAKHHHVSHVAYDHTSILKFIETKFNLPTLTARDANADGMTDLFDFAHPDFDTKPDFSLATVQGSCKPTTIR